MPPQAPRRHLAGPQAIRDALLAGEPVQVLLVAVDALQEGPAATQLNELVALAQAQGARIWRGSGGHMRRMSRGSQTEEAIAVLGQPPEADLHSLFRHGGCVWLLSGVAYPSNVGFTVRTAEVAGADGVVVDARFSHADRSRISHVSMGADKVMPVLWESTEHALQEAGRAGARLVGLEDSGTSYPWQVDLTGPVVFVVGGEREGIAPELAARCHHMVRIPMAGFVPSYNLQAAVTALAVERLRQLAV